jgi:hypothetical protein
MASAHKFHLLLILINVTITFCFRYFPICAVYGSVGVQLRSRFALHRQAAGYSSAASSGNKVKQRRNIRSYHDTTNSLPVFD